MLGWLRRWRQRTQEQQIERLLVEVDAYRAQWREEHGDEPPPLSDDQRRQLKQLCDQLSPEARRRAGDFFGLDDAS